MNKNILKSLVFIGLFTACSASPYAGPRELYNDAKNQYSRLSRPQKIALAAGSAALVAGVTYYALQRNEGKLYNDIVETLKTKAHAFSSLFSKKTEESYLARFHKQTLKDVINTIGMLNKVITHFEQQGPSFAEKVKEYKEMLENYIQAQEILSQYIFKNTIFKKIQQL